MSAAPAHWFILGAGSIGCLYAAYLQRAGIATTLLLRDATRLQQFHAAGLTLQIDDVQWPVPIVARPIAARPIAPQVVTDRPIAQLLLCTKAHHSGAAIAAVRAQLASNATVVLLQNGMGVREELQALLPCATFVHALSTEGAWQPQRFHVVHAGRGETIVGGGIDSAPAAAQVVADLARSGLNARAVDDIEQRLWQKLAVNCVINPLTALHRCRNGELLNLPDIDAQLDAICTEVVAVAATAGVALDTAALTTTTRAVMRSTAANRSSMLQDVEAGRITEITYINGFIARLAERHGIAAPHNARLLHAVQARVTPGAR